MPSLDPQTLIAGRVTPTLIDVRSRDEFLHEAIPNARCVPLEELTAAAATLDREAEICVVCQQGIRSAKAVAQLHALGFRRVTSLAGGITAYRQAGGPIARYRAGLPLQRQVFLTIGSLLLMTTLMAHYVHPAYGWLSGAIGLGLIVAGATGFCGMARLLARMPWNRHATASDHEGCARCN